MPRSALQARGIDNQLTAGDYVQLLTPGARRRQPLGRARCMGGRANSQPVAALVGLCAWMFLVETTSESFVPDAARFLRGGAGNALAGNSDELPAAVSPFLLALCAAAVALPVGV
jgi:hypothetical protein